LIPVYQTIISSTNGNCTEAVYASLLELDLDEIPNFHEKKGHYWDAIGKFLRQYDLQALRIDLKRLGGIEFWKNFMVCGYPDYENRKPKGFHGITVKSKTYERGHHFIVGLNGEPYFDVNPNFIAEEIEYEIVTYVVLVSTNPANNKKKKNNK